MVVDPYPRRLVPRIGAPITILNARCSRTVPFPALLENKTKQNFQIQDKKIKMTQKRFKFSNYFESPVKDCGTEEEW